MTNSKTRTVLFSVWILCAMVVVVTGSEKTSAPAKLPRCLGQFCPSTQHWSKARLIRRYGQGAWVHDIACYQDPVANTFVHFDFSGGRTSNEVSGVFLSEAKNCTSFRVARRTFGSLATPEGIRIGSSYDEVLRAYGAPTSTEPGTAIDLAGTSSSERLRTAPFGDRVLIYSSGENSVDSAQFYMTAGKVSAIAVSSAE